MSNEIQKTIGSFLGRIVLGKYADIIVETSTKVSSIEKTLDKFCSTVDTHDRDIAGIKVHTKFGISNSPTVPNELGKKLLTDSKFTIQYPKIKTALFALMDAMQLRTLYDYEKGAVEALEKLKDSPEFDPLKEYAVNTPEAPLELIFMVASWVIRDDYSEYKK